MPGMKKKLEFSYLPVSYQNEGTNPKLEMKLTKLLIFNYFMNQIQFTKAETPTWETNVAYVFGGPGVELHTCK